MNILLINGSPKANEAIFCWRCNNIEGFKEGYKSKMKLYPLMKWHVASMNGGACKGLLCMLAEDTGGVLHKWRYADCYWENAWNGYCCVVVSSGTIFSVPGILKNVIDRQLPMSLAVYEYKGWRIREAAKLWLQIWYGRQKACAKSLTCGFLFCRGKYDSVLWMFDYFLEKRALYNHILWSGWAVSVKELSKRGLTNIWLR